MKMTDAYDYQSFYEKIKDCCILDCKSIEGTRCYLDDLAKDALIDRLVPFGADGIHFIDSGNYHYLSLLWLAKIQEDFNLVLFDHHPDNQPPSFGMITSCGGWILEAQETLPHLKQVYTYGVGEEVPTDQISGDLPIYISIDKVRSQSVESGHSFKRELFFLAVHGLLHLLGYDHMNKEDEKIMFAKQEEVLSRYGIER